MIEKFYPKVIIPKTIQDQFVPPSEPNNLNIKLLSFIKERFIFVMIAIALIAIGIAIGNGIPLGFGIIIIIYQFFAVNTYMFQKKKYEELLREYNDYVYSRSIELNSYNFEINGITTLFTRDFYYVNKLDRFLVNTYAPLVTINKCKKGISELAFKKYLHNYFSFNGIDNDYEVAFDKVKFYPDFVIKVKVGSNTAYIDIEIDEPYSLDSKPIHYIGSDDFRNSCFEKLNWIVIRFAEEQVMLFPKECCELIGSVSKYLYSGGVEKILYQDSIRIPQWTSSQSLQMMKNNYRYSYWPKAQEIKTNT